MFSKLIAWFKAEINGVKRYVIYGEAVGKAVLHGGWASLSASVAAAILDPTKFNVTNGLKSEFDLLLITFLASGALAGYLYVKENGAPKA